MNTRPHERALPFSSLLESELLVRAAAPSVHPAPDTKVKDEDLIACLCRRDTSALEVLFDRYSRLFMGIGLRVLGDRGEAEEIVQEIFLYIYKKASLYNPERGVARQWLLHVAYHRTLDRREYLSRRGFYLGTDIHSLDDSLSGGMDLDREIAARLSRAQLEKAFAELPDRQRRTLELFYFQGLDLREISKELNEPLQNVRHHYYRGLEKLRKSSFIQKLREK